MSKDKEHKGHKRIAYRKIQRASYLLYEVSCMLVDDCPELTDIPNIAEKLNHSRIALDYLRLLLSSH